MKKRDIFVRIGEGEKELSPKAAALLEQLGITSLPSQEKYLSTVLYGLLGSWKDIERLNILDEEALRFLHLTLLTILTRDTIPPDEFSETLLKSNDPLVKPELQEQLIGKILLEGSGKGFLDSGSFSALENSGLPVSIHQKYHVRTIPALKLGQMSPKEINEQKAAGVHKWRWGVGRKCILRIHTALNELLEIEGEHGELSSEFFPFYENTEAFVGKFVEVGMEKGKIPPRVRRQLSLRFPLFHDEDRFPAAWLATLTPKDIYNMSGLGQTSVELIKEALAMLLDQST